MAKRVVNYRFHDYGDWETVSMALNSEVKGAWSDYGCIELVVEEVDPDGDEGRHERQFRVFGVRQELEPGSTYVCSLSSHRHVYSRAVPRDPVRT
jgi:hypothetical protein